MSTAAQPRRSGSDATTGAVPFSYAQAAKGVASTTPSTGASSKPSSGMTTPAKDATSTNGAVPSVPSWADDTEAEVGHTEKQPATREDATPPAPAPTEQPTTQAPVATSVVSSPDLGASSASTAVKDDDASSLQNSSESTSTWENKSQASTSVEKSTETTDKTSQKGKGKNSEKANARPLQEAPIPAVNVWARRADELKAKAAQKPATPKSTGTGAPNGTMPAPKKGRPSANNPTGDVKEKSTSLESRSRTREDRSSNNRKEPRPESESDGAKKGYKGRFADKDVRSAPSVLPLPPDRDQESWPTPETAVDEDRKKAMEKPDKERKDSSAARPHGKQDWVSMPYTPTVVFNTPLPNAAASRRGGRGPPRGGAQAGRGGAHMHSVGNTEKDVSAPVAQQNGEGPRRGGADAPAFREDLLHDKDAPSGDLAGSRENKSIASAGDKASKVEGEGSLKDGMDSINGVQGQGQNNTYPRQYPSNRPTKGRRNEYPAFGDRRRDHDQFSPSKDMAGSHDRRASAAVMTEGAEEGDRRQPFFQEGQNGLSKGRPHGFNGRDRGRPGRGRGGAFQNGHAMSNGHPAPPQQSSTFPMRSPPTFTPEQNSFFPAASTHGRGYRNGPRSQSVATENVYGRGGAYHGGSSQMPPMQPYMGGMYDYPMMQAMSAVPFGPYGMDQGALFHAVSAQVEYYFSVENLCKDIFLRKHMDSKGFVLLNVIADFNRLKQLTTDVELVKFVCYQSPTIEFRVGVDGKDRLRRREGWEQWVLGLSERDASAQNDGPDELHNPPMPHPNGFEQVPPMYANAPMSPTNAPSAYGTMNGGHSGLSNGSSPATAAEFFPNGSTPNGVNGFNGANGHAVESSKAVSGELDSFSDSQVETLSVIVRQQGQSPTPHVPPSVIRTFSNGSIDSKNGLPDAQGAHLSSGSEDDSQTVPQSPKRSQTDLIGSPVRLYWVKGKENPVQFIPGDSAYESYLCLRSKALEQRRFAVHDTCPYDMNILYQFWSHFLVRNFNLRMYSEFRQLALEDFDQSTSYIGYNNLLKFYEESLSASHGEIRMLVACHFVELARSDFQGSAFRQLQSSLRNINLNSTSRKRINDLLDDDLRAALE